MLKPTQTQPFQPESRSTSWEHTKLLWNSSSGGACSEWFGSWCQAGATATHTWSQLKAGRRTVSPAGQHCFGVEATVLRNEFSPLQCNGKRRNRKILSETREEKGCCLWGTWK